MITDTLRIYVEPEIVITNNIILQSKAKNLDVVVISAGKYEQKLEEITVSMEVIKPALIESKNTTNIITVLEQVHRPQYS